MRANPQRLAFARKRRGLTQTRLALECGVAVRNVRRYEDGDIAPSAETLNELARVLQYPIEFLTDPTELQHFDRSQASFRSLSTMTQQQADAALCAGSLAYRVSVFLEQFLKLPVPNVPDLEGTAPENAAEQVRGQWLQGNHPIKNVVHLLERHGIRVFSLAEDCRSVDAFCVERGGIPFVFLNTLKSAEHSRFDAAHELGHLVLHRSTARNGREVELEAHRFASAFLMPAADVLAHAPRNVSLESILELKQRWRVSAVALARRLNDLGLVREWQYKQLCITLSRLGYRTNEPNPIPREQSQLLKKAFDLLKERGITRIEVASQMHLPVDELDRLLFHLVMLPVTGDAHQPVRSSNRPRLRLVGKRPLPR
jgi:Zn-dependent peptidase ImmA (M78 family)/DNA-binding XRE family transcriptional regulator